MTRADVDAVNAASSSRDPSKQARKRSDSSDILRKRLYEAMAAPLKDARLLQPGGLLQQGDSRQNQPDVVSQPKKNARCSSRRRVSAGGDAFNPAGSSR